MLHGLLVVVSLVTAAAQKPPRTGRDLIRAMHDRYAGKWYHTLVFTQHNTTTRPDGTKDHSTWREYAALPGQLRIDFLPADSGNGVLFTNDSQYTFAADTIANAIAFVHPLMVLGFDVYVDPVEKSIARLEQYGFDLTRVREDVWHGRTVYIVGEKPGDGHSRQFWVDKGRLLFVRMLEPARRDSTKTTDTRFNRYQPVGSAWLSAEVEFLVDEQPRWLEQYVDIKTDTTLSADLFDPKQWKTARH